MERGLGACSQMHRAEQVGGTGGGEHGSLAPSVVREQPACPCTLFQCGGEAHLRFTTMLGGGGGMETVPCLGLKLERGGEGIELGGCGVESTGEERSCLKDGILGGSGLVFSLPSYSC